MSLLRKLLKSLVVVVGITNSSIEEDFFETDFLFSEDFREIVTLTGTSVLDCGEECLLAEDFEDFTLVCLTGSLSLFSEL